LPLHWLSQSVLSDCIYGGYRCGGVIVSGATLPVLVLPK
jgi:hypothetical protein